MLDRFKLPRFLLLAITASLIAASPLSAQDLLGGGTTETEAAPPPTPPAAYASPRATFQSFFDGINQKLADGSPAPDWPKVFGAMDLSAAASDGRRTPATALEEIFNRLV